MKKFVYFILLFVLSGSGFLTVLAADPDLIPPVVEVDGGGDWEDGPMTLEFSYSDSGGSNFDYAKYCETEVGSVCDPSKGNNIPGDNESGSLDYEDDDEIWVYFQGWDHDTNASEVASTSVRIDSNPPEFNISPSDGWIRETTEIEILCEDSVSGCNENESRFLVYNYEPDNCLLAYEDGTLGASVEINEDSWICAYAEDVTGNSANSNPMHVRYDDEVPESEDLNLDGSWQNEDYFFSLTCDDNSGSGCDETFLSVVPYGESCVASVATSTWNVFEYSTACWRVSDIAGNVMEQSVEVTVDRINPSIDIISPESSSWHNVNIVLEFDDFDIGGSGLEYCEYRVESGLGDEKTLTHNWSECTSSSAVLISVGPEGDCNSEGEDTCLIKIRSRDGAQNYGEDSIILNIDWTNPMNNIDYVGSAESGWYATTTVITLTCNDDNSSCKSIKYRWDEINNYSVHECSGDCSLETETPEGENTLYFYSVDLADNNSEEDSEDFLVDLSAPIVSAGLDQIMAEDFVQNASASDIGSGIDSYSWSAIDWPAEGSLNFSDSEIEDPLFSADIIGTYVARLTIVDNVGHSSYDDMTLHWLDTYVSGLNIGDINNLLLSISSSSAKVLQIGENLRIIITSSSTENIVITVGSVGVGTTSLFDQILLNAYEINIEGDDLGIRVEISYQDGDFNESAIAPYVFNSLTGRWELINNFTVDILNNVVVFYIQSAHTPYAIFAPENTHSSGGSGFIYRRVINKEEVDVATTSPRILGIDNIVQADDFIQKKELVVLDDVESELKVILSGNANLFSINSGTKINKETESFVYNKYTKKYLEKKDFKNIYSINNFMSYGTVSTKKIGLSERAGVLESYYNIFNIYPKTKEQWSDILKISNGRWPLGRNKNTEWLAEEIFHRVYLRYPNKLNQKDQTAIMLFVYGLRPKDRSIESEKQALETFFNIYSKYPEKEAEWNIIRTIAYSGATR